MGFKSSRIIIHLERVSINSYLLAYNFVRTLGGYSIMLKTGESDRKNVTAGISGLEVFNFNKHNLAVINGRHCL